MASSSEASAARPAVSAAATHPAVKISFALLALALIGGLVVLKSFEYVRFRAFSTEAVMDPVPMQRSAPAFSLPSGPSQPVIALDSVRGSYSLVHFWATWCPPCRDELRSLEYLTRKLKGRVQVLAVTVDEDWDEVERFFGGQPPSFKMPWDPERKTARDYGTDKFPETYLVDPQGRIVAKFIGARDWNSDEAKRYFDELLGG